jgi:hypothetical protein
MNDLQSASAVMMVQPDGFGFDSQTAATNAFQNDISVSTEEIRSLARKEFTDMVTSLRKNGIQVVVFKDQENVASKPNAVFPNNWLSTWPDGRVFLYPMATESRRIERSFAALQTLSKDFKVSEITDITEVEAYGKYLESTGVMVFDHQHKIVYGCISPRCDASLFTSHALLLGYEPVLFHAYDPNGTAIYHTNVLMGIERTTAVICSEAITDIAERRKVLEALIRTGHEVVEITQEQMNAFCGNVLELRNNEGEYFLAMSKTAFRAFTVEQHYVLGQDKVLLPFDITTIETVGGGSARCMLAEVFLPRKPIHKKDQSIVSMPAALAAI